jgi:hypothetical protein
MSNNVTDRMLVYLAGGGVKTFTTSPSTVTGNYKALYMCRNSQFISITATGDIKKSTRISSKTSFAAGTVIQGTITAFKLKGGAIFAIE